MNLKLIKLPDIQVIHTTTGLENKCKTPYADPARQTFDRLIHVEPKKLIYVQQNQDKIQSFQHINAVY